MSDIIIIGFNNDTRTYELPRDIIKKYPNSILSLYEASASSDPIIITDMTYEQFGIIHDVITDKVKQWMVEPYIFNFMDKYGLIDDTLLTLHNIMIANMNSEFVRVDNFLKDGDLLMAKDKKQYIEYKKIFENNKNVMSVQVTCQNDKIICINLLDSVPIYFEKSFDFNNMDIKPEMDVNEVRYDVIIKGLGCEKCKICDDCNVSCIFNKTCKNCQFCEHCPGWREELHKIEIDDFIYATDQADYFSAMYDIINPNPDDYGKQYQKLKSNTMNMLNWSTITIPAFTDNIPKSLNKITSTIIENRKKIIKYYELHSRDIFDMVITSVISCCNGPICEPSPTYRGFINVTNILK
jgi:hypothetical protein